MQRMSTEQPNETHEEIDAAAAEAIARIITRHVIERSLLQESYHIVEFRHHRCDSALLEPLEMSPFQSFPS